MKKMMIALGLAAAIAAGSMTVSAENYWKYNDTISIDMDETKVKTTTNGHEILHFVAVEAIDGGSGRVKVGDSVWTANGPDTPVGARVRILGMNGNHVNVEAAP